MPFALPAAAVAASAAAPAVVASAGKAAFVATLKTVALDVAKNLAISAVMSALSPKVGAGGRTDEWSLNPDGPIPFAAGRVGVPGSVVYRKTYGPDLMYYGIPSVLSGAGPIDGFESFLADDESVTFDGNGKAITSQYANELWYRNRLGTQPDTALPSPIGLKNGATLPGWTSAHKLSGKASYLIVMGENSKGSAYPTGEIKPLITFRGLKGWDPRLDSTYPGGSGACRLNDASTWVYITNPLIWALKWCLGLWEDPVGKGVPQVGYQVGGIGAKISGIDVPAFVSAANVADANGWTVAAYPTTDDDKAQVLDSFLQAGGCVYAQRAGKISCIQRAAPRTSIVTISAADTAGPLEIDTAASRIDRINTIRPTFWSPAHRWQMTALPEVTVAAYRTEDGGIRSRPLVLPYVSNSTQATQLAALQIANTREGIAGVIPLKPHLQRIKPGDAFTITEAGFVLNGLKCLCLNTSYDPSTGVVRVTFVSETDAKYPFALGLDPTPPSPPVLTPVDPTYVTPPAPGDWTVTPRPPGGDGVQVPIIDISGEVTNDTATEVIFEWGDVPDPIDPGEPLVDQIAWKVAYSGPPTTTQVSISGLQPGQLYYLAATYRRGSNFSARTMLPDGPFTAPGLSVTVDLTPEQIEEILEGVLGDAVDEAEAAAAAAAAAATAASASAAVAATARDESGNSAAASASSASTALAAQTAAGASASAALASKVASETAQSAASVSAISAAGSEEAANGSAVSAALFAQRIQASTFGQRLPGTFENGDLFTDQVQTNALTPPATIAIGTFVNVTGEGRALQISSNQNSIGTKAVLRLSPGRSYRNAIRVRVTVDPTVGGPINILYGWAAFDGLGLHLANVWLTGSFTAITSADGWQDRSQTLTTEQIRANSGLSNAAYIRPIVSPAWSGPGNNGTGQVVSIVAEEVTDAAGLQAAINIQATAIADSASKLADARFEIVAEASGGRPARFRMRSDSRGTSSIAFDAAAIEFGSNSVFDDPTDTLTTTVGAVKRILAWGAPFGADGNLLEWWGPTSVGNSAASVANGYSGRMTVAPYTFDYGLAGFAATANRGNVRTTNATGTVVSTVAIAITVTGAIGTVDYTWDRVGGDSRISVNSPTAASTLFTITELATGETATARFVWSAYDQGSGRTQTGVAFQTFTNTA